MTKAPATTTARPSQSVILTKDRDCKGSVRFTTDDIKAPVDNIYISRAMNGINDAQSIRVTVEILS